MELQIQDLLSAIKNEGIEKANKEANALLEDARKQSAEIVARARADADAICAKAREDADNYISNARLSAEQAKRDAMLSFKESVKSEFERLLTASIGRALDDKALASLIRAALDGEDASGYTAEVHEVSEALKGELAEQIKSGLEIRVGKSVRHGFKLAARDGSGFFDCTDDGIFEMLRPFFRDIQL